MVVSQTDDDCRLWAETRLVKMLEAMPVTAALLPANAYDKRKMDILCPGCPIHFGGANRSNLQGKSLRWLICDETWTFAIGLLGEALARLHDRANGCAIICGQAGIAGDEHDKLHATCERFDYAWRCPDCGALNAYDTGDLKFDEVRDANTRELNLEAFAKTVRMVCPAFSVVYDDTEKNRRDLALGGEYKPVTSNAYPGRIGYHVNALALYHVEWWRYALDRALAYERMYLGDASAMRTFKMKREAVWWLEEDSIPHYRPQQGGYRIADYEHGELLDGEALRTVCADKQLNSAWIGVRAWRTDGSSRLLWAGEVSTWEDVLDIAKKYAVPGANTLCSMDSRYNTFEVCSWCASNGFIALEGDPRAYWTWTEGRTQTKKPFSPIEHILASGLRCPSMKYSAQTIKDCVQVLRLGKMLKFEVPDDICEQYSLHMNSERRQEVVTASGKRSWQWRVIGHRSDHLKDCECAAVSLAMAEGLVNWTNGMLEIETMEVQTVTGPTRQLYRRTSAVRGLRLSSLALLSVARTRGGGTRGVSRY
jgi:phage terminase large subunit GpA